MHLAGSSVLPKLSHNLQYSQFRGPPILPVRKCLASELDSTRTADISDLVQLGEGVEAQEGRHVWEEEGC